MLLVILQNRVSQEFLSSRDPGLIIWIIALVAGFIFTIAVVPLIIRNIIGVIKGRRIKLTRELPQEIFQFGRELNGFQRKIIHEVIDGFKREDLVGRNISSTVLEKYSEYFLKKLHGISITEEEIKRFKFVDYPILKDTVIDLELIIDGKLFLFETRVLYARDNGIAVKYIDTHPLKLERGMEIKVDYNINKNYYSGYSTVGSVIPDDKIVISKPKKVVMSDERHYSRIPLEKTAGEIRILKEDNPLKVDLLDISPEGARIRSMSSLRKNTIYRLKIQDHLFQRDFVLDSIDCIISKVFVKDRGTYEYGLAFIQMSAEVRSLLLEYLRLLLQKYKR